MVKTIVSLPNVEYLRSDEARLMSLVIQNKGGGLRGILPQKSLEM